jgi:PAS domain S-box-containing protein
MAVVPVIYRGTERARLITMSTARARSFSPRNRFGHAIVRYAFAVATVAAALGLRKLLEPATGTGASFVLYFGAVLTASFLAGHRAGTLAAVLSTPLGVHELVVRAGFAPSQAAYQGTLFAVDCALLVYFSALTSRTRRASESAQARARLANEAAAIGCWDLNVATRCLRWSPDLAFPGGGPASADRWLSLVHSDDRDAFARAHARSLDPACDGTFRTEVRLVRPDGGVRWFSWMGRTYFEETTGGRLPTRQIGVAVDVTERREREDALTRMSAEVARSASHLHDLIELAPDAFFLADLEGRYTEVNQAACRMLGYDHDELVGKTILDLIPAEDAPRLAATRTTLLVPGQVIRSEWRLRRKDGTFVPVEVSANILSDDSWQAFVRDISERKRIEDERQVFVSLLDNAPDFIGIEDPSGKPVYINPAGRRMVGLATDYPVEQTRTLDYYPPEERAFEVDVIARSMVERGHWSGETSFRNWQTQETIPVSSARFMIRDATGARVLGIGTVTRDVSEARQIAREREELLVRDQAARQEAEATNARLGESGERFRLVFDEAPIGMALVALDGRLVRVNRALCEIVGYAKDELERLTFQDITHPEDLAIDVELADQLARGEIPRYQLEKRYIRNDGAIVTSMLSGSVVRTSDGVPLYYIAQIEDITKRKRAEEALQTSEREFRSLAESMPQIVWATRADGLNIYFNQQWVDYTGLAMEDSYGEGWIIPFHPDDRQRAWDAWQRATRHRDAYSLECRLRRADGVYQWWLVRGVPLLGANGEILKWFGTCTDIEHIKVAEQKLKESEAKFSGIISISADAIISIDDEQRITIFNNGAEQIFGYSKAEAIGTSLGRLIPERSRRVHGQHVEGFASGDVTARRMGERFITIAGLRKNGEEFPAEAAISKLQVGDKTFLTVALRDVTERKRIEKEQQFLAEAGAVLAASLDYEQTLATVAHLVVRDFADWCIVEIVEHHEQIRRLKVASADLSKAELCAVLEQMPIERELPYLLRAVVDTKQPLVIEHVTSEQLESVAQGPEYLQALRAVSPASLMALPLLRHGQLLGVLVFISSGPRHYGRSDLRLAEALADRAAVAIENARLYNASVEATQIRDQVLGFVAHDLRNPLGAITMQASLLQRSGAEPERRSRKPVETIQRAAARMNRLIQDILDVSRMEGGHLSVEQARVPAAQIVSDSVEAQKPLASSASIDLQPELEMGVSDVWADRDRVLQVFENLIGNAVRCTKPGGRITAGAASRDGEVVFWVKDTGAGITAEEMPHIFDRFWQARKTRRAGAGLGLQIVKGIIEAHGGRIWVESKVGVGTTFYFTLPTAQTTGTQPIRAEMH